MPSFKVLFKGVEMISNHCSDMYSITIEIFIATKAMLTLYCLSVRYYSGTNWEVDLQLASAAIFFVIFLLQPRPAYSS